jgi:DNA-binding YbaB/EbfC family protein
MKLPGNMQTMMKQAQQMQEKMAQEVAQIRVEASSGGGMVSVKMDGNKNLLSVKIDPEVEDEAKQKMGGLLGGLGLPPGMF